MYKYNTLYFYWTLAKGLIPGTPMEGFFFKFIIYINTYILIPVHTFIICLLYLYYQYIILLFSTYPQYNK